MVAVVSWFGFFFSLNSQTLQWVEGSQFYLLHDFIFHVGTRVTKAAWSAAQNMECHLGECGFCGSFYL